MPGVRGVEHGSKRNVRNPFHIGLTPEEQRQVWVDINRRTQRQRDQSSGAADSRSDPWDGSTLVGGDEDSETLSEVGHRKPHGHYDSRDVYHDECVRSSRSSVKIRKLMKMQPIGAGILSMRAMKSPITRPAVNRESTSTMATLVHPRLA